MVDEFTQGNEESVGYPSSNNISEDALRLRLDPTGLLTNVECFLKGEKIIIKDNEYVIEKISDSLANDEGIQNILQILSFVVSKDTVQGNLDVNEINQIVYDIKLDLAFMLAFNCKEWDIKRENRVLINHNVERLVKIFLSRTKDNKERESYGMRTVHSSRDASVEKSRGFGFFNKH